MISSSSFVIIPNWTCNDPTFVTLNISQAMLIESIEIGDNCFGMVNSFRIDGLNLLKSLKIGKNSFTQLKYSWGNNESKSFHILNCESLESIEIGEFSFSDFGGEFELRNLPSLQSIQIGIEQRNSNCFYSSSFVIRGILNNIEN